MMGEKWLTRNEDCEADEGNYNPKVIPPEGTLPESEGDPSNGDRARYEEASQRGICGGRSVRVKRDEEWDTDI